jgi:glyoxylate reductase
MRVLVTRTIADEGMALLEQAGLDIDLWEQEGPIPAEALRARAAGCAGVLSMLTDPIDGALLDAGPVRAVAQHAVGVDNIDLAACAARGVAVSHTPGVLTDATADLAMALLLGVGRRLREGDAMVRAGGFHGWAPTMLRGLDLAGARLGIVGWGRIGQAVARRAAAFGMEVVHHSRSSGIALEELLATSDVVSLHCPLTPATHHLLDAPRLAQMKRGAILINTARGPVVDEAALVDALDAGRIAGAGLDVYEREPAVHPGLLGRDDVLLLPHLGSATWGTRRRMAVMAAGDLVAMLRGEPAAHPVPLPAG